MKLDKNTILEAAISFLDDSPVNHLVKDAALRPDLAGMRFYDAPVIGAAAAEDPLFEGMRSIEAVGPMFMPPGQWLPGAVSVVSLFFPYTDTIVDANAAEAFETPPEWLHGRYEGHETLVATMEHIKSLIERAGYAAVIPSSDSRFKSGMKDIPGRVEYTSSWSERHVAYVCGLGTFGMSRCLITRVGAAGRFGSLVTNLALEPTTRPYTRYDEYCDLCGLCATVCPANAIDPAKGINGKDMEACGKHQQLTREKHAPRYGCGKCSVGVPCSRGIPGR